jgi:hypothetical protein
MELAVSEEPLPLSTVHLTKRADPITEISCSHAEYLKMDKVQNGSTERQYNPPKL